MKILIATDGSDFSQYAVQTFLDRPWPEGSEVRLLSILDHPVVSYVTTGELLPMNYNDLDQQVRTNLEKEVAATAARIEAESPHAVTWSIREGRVAEEIIDEAKLWGADLIMMGTHGRHGLSRFLLGSVAERIVSHAPCSVEVVRKPTPAHTV